MSKGHRLLDLALLLLLFTEVQLICFPDSSVGKESACSAGDPGLVPGSGRSAGEGIGYPLQYSGLKNSMDCMVHGVAKSQTRLSDFHLLYSVVLVSGVRQSDSVIYLALDLKSVFT